MSLLHSIISDREDLLATLPFVLTLRKDSSFFEHNLLCEVHNSSTWNLTTYGMKLKLGPMTALDKRRHFGHVLSV